MSDYDEQQDLEWREMLARPPHEVMSIARDSAAETRSRMVAIWAIRHLQVSEDAKRGFLDELLKQNSPVVHWVVYEIPRLGGERSVERLRKLFREAQYAKMRGHALQALANMSDTWIVPHCAEMLRSETGYAFTLAAHALGTLGSTEALDLLTKTLLDESKAEQKGLLAGILARHSVRAAEPFLVEALEREEDDIIRLAHATALANLKNPIGVRVLKDIVTACDVKDLSFTLYGIQRFSDFQPAPGGGDPRKQIFTWLEGKP